MFCCFLSIFPQFFSLWYLPFLHETTPALFHEVLAGLVITIPHAPDHIRQVPGAGLSPSPEFPICAGLLFPEYLLD